MPDIIIITEHGLKPEQIKSSVLIQGYILKAHYSRETHKKGGVAIYVKDTLAQHSEAIDVVQLSQEFICEVALIKISTKNTCLFIMGTYRSPDRNLDEALEVIAQILDQKQLDKSPLLIMGDINVDNLKSDRKNMKVNETLASYNIKRVVLPPTRITPNSASSIDWICTNGNTEDLKIEVIHAGLSDHTAQTCTLHVSNKAQEPKVQRRCLKSKNLLELKSLLQHEDWENVLQATTTEAGYKNLLKTLKLVLDTACPLKTSRRKLKHKPKHFVDKEAYMLKEEYLKSLLNYQFTGSTLDKGKTADLKKAYDQRLKSLRKEASTRHISRAENKSKATWEVINNAWDSNMVDDKEIRLNIDGVITDNAQTVAEYLNNFFVNIAEQTLSSNIGKKSTTAQRQSCANELPFLTYTNKDEIATTIKHLKTKHSAGIDEISSKILKYCCEELSGPLTNIINLSFKTGEFPSDMKISKVYPKFKSGCTTQTTNYRPISLVPTFAKVCEKIVLKRLLSHCKQHNLLTDVQHGFTKGKSTTSAMIKLIETITDNLEAGKLTTALFLDFSKAFDCLSHELIITKLKSLGITGTALQWFKSYLAGRSQLVELRTTEKGVIKGVKSRLLPVHRGVPQGSVLGPVLFILFTNDLPQHLRNLCSTLMYADDTTLLLNSDTADDLAVTSFVALNTAYQYCHGNDLVVNPSKTNQVAFGRRAEDVPYIPGVKLSSEAKFLGITIDSNLTWTPHVDNLCKKLSTSLYALRRIITISEQSTALTAYFALFEAHMRYGLAVWGGTCSGNLKRVLIF